MTKVALFCSFLLSHWIIQFLVWAYATRNSFVHYVWNVLSAPLFYISQSLNNEHFWVVATMNSLLWAACLTFLVGRILTKQ